MVQMPLLLGAIYLYFGFMLRLRAGEVVYRNAYFMGLLLAFSAGIMINNCFIVLFSGIGVGLAGTSWKQWRMAYSLRLWGAAAIVGIPIFIAGYLLSGQDHGFFAWMLSYGGDAGSKLNKLYGIKASLYGVMAAFIGVVYHTILGSVLKIPGFGNVIMKGFLSRSPLEFIPDYSMIASNIVLAPAIIALNIRSGAFITKNIRLDASVRFLALWIAAYIAFNFYWTAGDDIFWFQIIPAIWLLLLMAQGFMTAITPHDENNVPSSGRNKWGWYLIIALVPLLVLVNTRTVVLPVTGSEYSVNQARHEALFRNGDLEIIPGWDSQKWMMSSKDAPAVRKIGLMNAALAPEDSPDSIKKLDDIVGNHIRNGQRVIVARLYDLDHDLMPWYALKEIGWPRKKIQGLLSAYCNRPIAVIDGVTFRQLYACPSPEKTGSPAAGAPGSQDTMERSDNR